MVTAQAHPDVLAVFNDQLAHAKLGALRVLQDLMSILTRPDAAISAATRELRQIATTILRTQPLKPAAPNTPAAAPTPPPERDQPPTSPPASTSIEDAIALATHVLTTPARELKGNPDIARLLARRTATATGAPAP